MKGLFFAAALVAPAIAQSVDVFLFENPGARDQASTQVTCGNDVCCEYPSDGLDTRAAADQTGNVPAEINDTTSAINIDDSGWTCTFFV